MSRLGPTDANLRMDVMSVGARNERAQRARLARSFGRWGREAEAAWEAISQFCSEDRQTGMAAFSDPAVPGQLERYGRSPSEATARWGSHGARKRVVRAFPGQHLEGRFRAIKELIGHYYGNVLILMLPVAWYRGSAHAVLGRWMAADCGQL